MSNSLSWVIVAIICAVAEIFTAGFFIIWFGGGALAAALVAKIGLSLEWQFGSFVVVSTVLVLSTKKLTAKLHRKGPEFKTNVYRIQGKEATVTVEIPQDGSGQVKIGGEIWSARAEQGGRIPAGVKVRVLRVSGVHAIVEPPE